MATRASPRPIDVETRPTAASWAQLRRVLLDEQARVMRRIAPLDDPLATAPDDCRRLNDVYLALDRMRRGTYGRCVACGTAIPVALLVRRAHTARCEACALARR